VGKEKSKEQPVNDLFEMQKGTEQNVETHNYMIRQFQILIQTKECFLRL
jgi:hypothetical protein